MRETPRKQSSLPSARTVLAATFALFVVAVVVPSVVFAAPQVVGADRSYIVMSGSMRPAIEAGDAIIVREPDPATIEAGDVIVFREGGRIEAASTGSIDVITHRVVEVRTGEDGRQFVTKGDANEDPDVEPVPAGAVVGEVWFHLPYLGHLLVFAGSRTGFVALVAVPLGLLVVTELWALLTVVEEDDSGEDGTVAEATAEE